MRKLIKNDNKKYITRAILSSPHKKTGSNRRLNISNNIDSLSFDIDSNWYFNWISNKNN